MSILDMLFQIVEKQIEFQKILKSNLPIYSYTTIYEKKNIDELIFQLLAMFDEISEALACIPWKPWKKNQKLDLDSFKEELMDIFHFLINCCLYVGMSAKDIFDEFMRKNKINVQRQKDGY